MRQRWKTIVRWLCVPLLLATSTWPGSSGTEASREQHVADGARPFAQSVNDYPRLASIYALSEPSDPLTFARYGLIVANRIAGTTGAVEAVKNVNPSARIVFYDNTSAVDLPSFDGLTIYPGWWLTLVGTRLSAPVDSSATTIHVVDAAPIARFMPTNPDVLVDGETMHVLSVDVARKTLTVERGYLSSPEAHAAGRRIAAHATKWPHTWMANVTPYCPVDPATGMTWDDYVVQQARERFAEAPWDGLLWDDGNVTFARLSQGQIDADDNNVADGGDGPSGTGWIDGIRHLLSLTRTQAPTKLQLVTDATYPGLMDGQEMEHFPYFQDGWASAFATYLAIAGPGGAAPFSIINPDTANKSNSSNLGVINLQQMRFSLGTALMGDGYFAYDNGADNHGQTWWFDEYDRGAGSSLASNTSLADRVLHLAARTGGRFHVDDVVIVPDDGIVGSSRTSEQDEQMLVTAVRGDDLTVQRGFDGSRPATHALLAKVLTQAQLLGGLGWLGQPLGPARAMPLTSPSQVANADFELGRTVWLPPWRLQVTAPAAATIAQDTHTFASGWASARITVTKAAPASGWDVALIQEAGPAMLGAHLVAGHSYTLSFWAKGNASQAVGAGVQQSVPPWMGRAYQTFSLTNAWHQYRMAFVAPVTESAIKIQFDLGRSVGIIWLDRIRFQEGDPNVWRRDFANGAVLLNATSNVQVADVGPGLQHIAGTQDPMINNAAVVTSVRIAPHDAVLLVRTSSTRP